MVFQIQYLSILVEIVIGIIGISMAVKKKRSYGFGIALTFFIYVAYDLTKMNGFNIQSLTLDILFFVATLSALWAALEIYHEEKVKPVEKVNKEKIKGKKK
jgi:hypothetical protein